MGRTAGLSLSTIGSSSGIWAAVLLLATGLGHPLPARADNGGSDCYQSFPQWDQVVALHEKVDAAEGITDDAKDPLDSRFGELQSRHDSYYDGTAELCTELHGYYSDRDTYGQAVEEHNKAFQAHEEEVAQQRAQCGGTSDDQGFVDRCNEWGARLDEEARRLDEEAAQLQQQKAELDQRQQDIDAEADRVNAEWTELLEGYITDAQTALDNQGFTGRKVYRMTAKSWVNGPAVTEMTIRGKKLRFEANNRPGGPYLNGNNDFKLFQTFTVQVDFVNGKVKKAEFLKDSLQQKAGSSILIPASSTYHVPQVGLQGAIYVTNQKIDKAPDEGSVTYTRTVEGRPNLLIVYPDYFGPGSTNFTPIYNTLTITVKSDGDPDVEGSGSAFPSHMFWLGDELISEQDQVQPSEFFGGH